jgi:hypothetical protein
VLGPPGNLKLKTFGATQGVDSLIAEVVSGWRVETGRPDVTVEVVENAPLTPSGTLAAGHLADEGGAAVLEIDGMNYLIRPRDEGSVTFQSAAPRLWVIKARLLGTQ